MFPLSILIIHSLSLSLSPSFFECSFILSTQSYFQSTLWLHYLAHSLFISLLFYLLYKDPSTPSHTLKPSIVSLSLSLVFQSVHRLWSLPLYHSSALSRLSHFLSLFLSLCPFVQQRATVSHRPSFQHHRHLSRNLFFRVAAFPLVVSRQKICGRIFFRKYFLRPCRLTVTDNFLVDIWT